MFEVLFRGKLLEGSNLRSDPPDMAPRVLIGEVEKHNLDRERFWILKHGETRLIKAGWQ